MHANEDECIAADLDVDEIDLLAGRISRAMRRLDDLDVFVFGGAGTGTLRYKDKHADKRGSLIVADLDGDYDGGDGADNPLNEDGLLRGEP